MKLVSSQLSRIDFLALQFYRLAECSKCHRPRPQSPVRRRRGRTLSRPTFPPPPELQAGVGEKLRGYSLLQQPAPESPSSAGSRPEDSVRRERSIQLNQAAE